MCFGGPTFHLPAHPDLDALLCSHLCAGVTGSTPAQLHLNSHFWSYVLYVAKLGRYSLQPGTQACPPCECMGASTPEEVSQRINASSSIPWMGNPCCALNTSSEVSSWTWPQLASTGGLLHGVLSLPFTLPDHFLQ